MPFGKSGILAALAGLCFAFVTPLWAAQDAVVTKHTIYPGQLIELGLLRVVDATHCPNCESGYFRAVEHVVGKLAVRTLLPGKLIFPADIRQPPAVSRGQPVLVFYRNGALEISMTGISLSEAPVDQEVSVKISRSNLVISGLVQRDGSVLVRE